MPPDSFLHERNDFKALVETVAESEKINDPALVEKDYWIMHAVFGLKQLDLTFELSGGTSLSMGYGIIQRFSEDVDIELRDKIKIPGITAVNATLGTIYDQPLLAPCW